MWRGGREGRERVREREDRKGERRRKGGDRKLPLQKNGKEREVGGEPSLYLLTTIKIYITI